MKKILSIFLCLVMVMVFMPATAWAEGNTEVEEDGSGGNQGGEAGGDQSDETGGDQSGDVTPNPELIYVDVKYETAAIDKIADFSTVTDEILNSGAITMSTPLEVTDQDVENGVTAARSEWVDAGNTNIWLTIEPSAGHYVQNIVVHSAEGKTVPFWMSHRNWTNVWCTRMPARICWQSLTCCRKNRSGPCCCTTTSS